MMEVIRVLNNNSVLCTDGAGGQAILLGKGIGFKRCLGDKMDPADADQVFLPSTSYPIGQLSALVSELPLDTLRVAHEVAALRQDGEPPQSLVLALADHLSFAMERVENDIIIESPLRWEVSQLYPREMALGQQAVALVRERHGIVLPEGESTALAMHFVNAQFTSGDLHSTAEMTEKIGRILELVEAALGVQFPVDSMDTARFVTHLRYLFVRLAEGKTLPAPTGRIAEIIAAQAPTEHAIARRIAALLAAGGEELSAEETAYLAMHVQRIAVSAVRESS